MGKVLKYIRGTVFFLYNEIIQAVKTAESVTDLVSIQW